MRFLNPDGRGIAAAVAILRAGGVVGFPTETVYGLAAGDAAVPRVYELKGRSETKPLVLMGASAEFPGIPLPEAGAALAARHWPGPLTLVVPDGRGGSIGLRVPDHPVALALLEASGPLWTTSANPSGEPEALTAAEVAERLPRLDAVIDGGPAPGGVASTVVDVTGPEPRVLRAGAIPADRL